MLRLNTVRIKIGNTQFFKILISAIIIIIVIKRGNIKIGDVLIIFKRIPPLVFIAAFAGFAFLMFLKSIRWNRLVSSMGFQLGIKETYVAYLSAFAVGIITPGRLGELSKAVWLINKYKIDFSPAFRTVISDRIYDLYFLICFGIVGLINIFSFYKEWVWLPQLLFILILMYLIILIGKKIITFLNLKNTKTNKIKIFILQIYSDFSLPSSALNFLITIFSYFVFFSICHLLINVLGISINFIQTSFIISCLSLVLLLPISIAGFGPREMSLVYLLGLYGVSQETALAFSLSQFLTFYFFGGILGVLMLWFTPISYENMKLRKYKIWHGIEA
ncbi:MAG TPA: flippase-like domain-containing protein [Ignavibacteria bacterium]|nr:flippase-like domain-containing protein [Ignavibacteria bacterium]